MGTRFSIRLSVHQRLLASRKHRRRATRRRPWGPERLEARDLLATFTVTNTNDMGAGSLRDAITMANTMAGPDVIEFNIPGSGIQTITPSAALPTLTEAVEIDGTTQPGFLTDPLIEINGSSAGSSDGLRVAGGNSLIRGLVINRFQRSGLVLDSDDNLVERCFIGTDATGMSAAANLLDGVQILADRNTVGGSASAVRNVISGNSRYGIQVVGSEAARILGNTIGANLAGAAAIPNGLDGVAISGAAMDAVVGGDMSGEGNLISGNVRAGIRLAGEGTRNHSVIGNVIGLNAVGDAALPNAIGVWLVGGASSNVIGGATSSASNVLSGNTAFGVAMTGTGTRSNQVANNKIGTDAAGLSDLGNGVDGIYIAAGASDNHIGDASVSTLRNIISGNDRNGVRIEGTGTTNNMIILSMIGLNQTGLSAVPNTSDGVVITGGASGNAVGTTAAAQRCFIGGNLGSGVVIAGAGTSNNVVLGNRIGTNLLGSAALGNAVDGVSLREAATGNLIGIAFPGGGNQISGHSDGAGLRISGAGTSLNLVRNNNFGLNAAGTGMISNQTGVLIEAAASDNAVGAGIPGARNIISGNLSRGVFVRGVGTVNNSVQGNFIGTNLTGTAALRNASGVDISFGASNNVVGGSTAATRNVISGNTVLGLSLQEGASNNRVQGNFIGTDFTGTLALGNRDGIVFNNASLNMIGGIGSGVGNLVSGNQRFGVFVHSSTGSTRGNRIEQNRIGTSLNGIAPLGNLSHGIFVTGSQSSDNTLGGYEANMGNTIAFNAGSGVLVGSDPATPFVTPAGTGNSILGNRIFGNSLESIDLGPNDGVTPNDVNDPDPGPNRLQNFPVLSLATSSDGSTLITGTLNSVANATYRLEFFAAASTGEAQQYLGFTTVIMAPAVNTSPFGVAILANVPLGNFVTATATNLLTGDTSELATSIIVF